MIMINESDLIREEDYEGRKRCWRRRQSLPSCKESLATIFTRQKTLHRHQQAREHANELSLTMEKTPWCLWASGDMCRAERLFFSSNPTMGSSRDSISLETRLICHYERKPPRSGHPIRTACFPYLCQGTVIGKARATAWIEGRCIHLAQRSSHSRSQCVIYFLLAHAEGVAPDSPSFPTMHDAALRLVSKFGLMSMVHSCSTPAILLVCTRSFNSLIISEVLRDGESYFQLVVLVVVVVFRRRLSSSHLHSSHLPRLHLFSRSRVNQVTLAPTFVHPSPVLLHPSESTAHSHWSCLYPQMHMSKASIFSIWGTYMKPPLSSNII